MLNLVEHGKGYLTPGPGQNLSRISCSSDFYFIQIYLINFIHVYISK